MTPSAAAQPPSALAAVMIDGGRLQTRQPDSGPGGHRPAWRETKTAVPLRMRPRTSATDPRPDLPACFAAPPGTAGESPGPAEPGAEAEAGSPEGRPIPPVRSGLATPQDSEAFGWTAAAAEGRGFFTAGAKAFVSDGLPSNWSIQRRHVADFEPIRDFVHAAEQVDDAAEAAGDTELGRHRAELCWRGRVDEVLAGIDEPRERIGRPAVPDDEPDHPWCALGRRRGYLQTDRARMDSPRYRREGPPITGSPVESWIKQLNGRVKGSEKSRNDGENAEAMLELRAAWLNDEEAFAERIRQRPGHPQARPPCGQQRSRAA